MRIGMIVAVVLIPLMTGCAHITREQREFDRRIEQFGQPDQIGYEIPSGEFVLSSPSAVREDLGRRRFGEPEESKISADAARGSRLTFYYFARRQQVVFEPGRDAHAEPIDPQIVARHEEGRRWLEENRPAIDRAVRQTAEQLKQQKR